MRPIQRLLVANRGEIALRIIRTARELNIATIAVYADADAEAPFVHAADEAWSLGGADATSTYLNAEALLKIADATHADALHPGYGFLSENADFANTLASKDITWIGPAGSVIDALGDKIRARNVAHSCGVDPVPGIFTPITDPTQITDFIAEHGYPVVCKRSDGGGGRGITVLRSDADADMFIARHTTPDAEGNTSLSMHFVERFVEVARHVETQCMRDAHGNFRVVTTRDCSVQRRNQKLIEEAPAPFLSPETDAQLERWSRQLFEAVSYVGVGTCEFLLEPDGSLWFLEVNPRLQVEHPVSEEVAGVDLVSEQLRIAQGLPLSEALPPRGHSFEFRITCEDPAADLMPSGGKVTHITWPGGPGIRIDSGLVAGDSVHTSFDSMIAKIIVTAPTREAALARSRRALAEFCLDGVPTPRDLYVDIINDPAFSGEDAFTVSTRWLENAFLPSHSYEATDTAENTCALPPAKRQFTIELDGKRMTLSLPPDLFQGVFGTGAATQRPAQPLRQARQERSAAAPTASTQSVLSDGTIVSPMQAIVVHMAVTENQKVAEGDLIAVLEAMKMEKYVHAPHAGTVSEIFVAAGTSISTGDHLVRIEKENA